MRRAMIAGALMGAVAAWAGGAFADPPAEAPPFQAPDPLPVPPGTPADQALWTATRDATHEVIAVRWQANALHLKMKTTDVVNRLNAEAKANPASADRIAGIRKRLGAAQVENYEIYSGRWPVDTTRVCQYPLLYLTSAMNGGTSADDRAALAEARDGAKKCVDLARLAVGRMERSNAALTGVIAEAEATLKKG